jgi:YD repeat-containing protein
MSFDTEIKSLHGGASYFVSTGASHRREFEDPDVGIDWNEEATAHFTGVDDPGDAAPLVHDGRYVVDDYGNVLEGTEETRGGVRREVVRTFDLRPAEWLVGLVHTQAERSYEVASTPPAKLHTLYHHDRRGLLDEVTIEPDSTDSDVRETTRLTYDAAGRVRQEKREAAGELPRIWNYEFDDVSGEGIFLSQTWNELGVSQWLVHHPAYGVLMAEVDANGASSTRIYDDLGRLVKTHSGAGPASEISRRVWMQDGKAAGTIVATSLASGGRAEATVDERGLVVEQANRAFDGRTVVRRMKHDVFGRPLSLSRPGFERASETTAERTYDSLNRVLTERGPEGAMRRHEPGLFQTVTTDPRGRRTRVTVDVNGRPIESAENEAGTWLPTQFTYGPNDQVAIVTDPKGHTTTVGYDLRGRRVSVRDPDAGKCGTIT